MFALPVLGSPRVPIPEETPTIAAAVLHHEGIVRWRLGLPFCLVGVLSGNMVLCWIGRHWGEDILNWRAVRPVLTLTREWKRHLGTGRLEGGQSEGHAPHP
jgi:membrane protein DedA with SNARE-associated domain